MKYQMYRRKSLTLTAVLIILAFACFAQQEMRINHVGGYTLPNPDSNTIYVMQGDTLALYDFTFVGRVINILYGTVSPTGAMQPLQSIFSYEVPTGWGNLLETPLFFEYKHGKFYSSFVTDAKLLVFFTIPASTDVHLFDKTGIQYVDNVYLIDETTGYAAASQYPNFQTWVCRLDFGSHTLPLFYQDLTCPNPDAYLFFSVFDDYLLMYTLYDGVPDILVHDGEIVDTFPTNWGETYTSGYYSARRLCGDHFFFEEYLPTYATQTVIGWVENNTLHRSVFDVGTEDWWPDNLYGCEPQSDSTFTCIFSTGHDQTRYFRNYCISNHTPIEDDFFPNLTNYEDPVGQFRMNDDYLVALNWTQGNNYNLILADYPQQSIRSYDFTTSDAMHSRFFHSDSLFYWLGQNGRVHIFRLEMGSDAEDDFLPPVSATLKAYPNPFNSSCTVKLETSRQTDASLGVFNLRGQLVKNLHQGSLKQGESSFIWDGRDAHGQEVSAGLYLLRLDSGGIKQSTKLVHIK